MRSKDIEDIDELLIGMDNRFSIWLKNLDEHQYLWINEGLDYFKDVKYISVYETMDTAPFGFQTDGFTPKYMLDMHGNLKDLIENWQGRVIQDPEFAEPEPKQLIAIYDLDKNKEVKFEEIHTIEIKE